MIYSIEYIDRRIDVQTRQLPLRVICRHISTQHNKIMCIVHDNVYHSMQNMNICAMVSIISINGHRIPKQYQYVHSSPEFPSHILHGCIIREDVYAEHFRL